jgi:hypothetical protein
MRPLKPNQRPNGCARRANTSLSGRLISLGDDPPSFVLETRTAQRSVRMPTTLRDAARELLGREVVVLADAIVNRDGQVSDPCASAIRASATAEDAYANFDETFGVMRGIWKTGVDPSPKK